MIRGIALPVAMAISGLVSAPRSLAQTVAQNVIADSAATNHGPVATLIDNPTPAELSTDIKMLREQLRQQHLTTLSTSYPKDSVQKALANLADAHVVALERVRNGTAIPSLQVDPFIQLLAVAGRTSEAKAKIEARLATPSLKEDEKAYTLYVAVVMFAESPDPQAQALVPSYLSRLDAMPAAHSAVWRFWARSLLADNAYRRGDAAGVTTYMMQAYRDAAQIPFLDRRGVFYSTPFLALVDVLSGQPNGRARIDSVEHLLLSLAVPPAKRLDPSALAAEQQMSTVWTNVANGMIALASAIGTPAPAIAAHYGFNTPRVHDVDTAANASPSATPSRLPQQLVLNDGTIRVIEVGDFGCSGCILALPVLQQFQAKLPRGVEALYVTNTLGAWSGRFVDPAEEAVHLRWFYLQQMRLTFPIALWAGEKRPTDDGGMLPETSPNDAGLHVAAHPAFFLVDGHGIIRHVAASFDRDVQRRMLDVIAYLMAEGHSATQPTTPVTTPATTRGSE